MEVEIQRSSGDGYYGSIEVDEIRGVRWDDISGGVNTRQKGYSLYGYINYSIGKELVKCSGRHDDGNNDMKIKILPAKKGSEYYEGYQKLLLDAGEKPTDKQKKYSIPCTKRILKEIEDKPIIRAELRKKLISENYPGETISGAIKTMEKDGRIITEGSGNSPKQLIRKNISKV